MWRTLLSYPQYVTQPTATMLDTVEELVSLPLNGVDRYSQLWDWLEDAKNAGLLTIHEWQHATHELAREI